MLKVELIGNIGNDAFVQNSNGSEYISMSVAHHERMGDTERTIWVSVSLPISFRNCLPFLRKGARIFLRGNIAFRLYDSSFTRQKEIGVNMYARELEIIHYAADVADSGGASDSENSTDADRPF